MVISLVISKASKVCCFRLRYSSGRWRWYLFTFILKKSNKCLVLQNTNWRRLQIQVNFFFKKKHAHFENLQPKNSSTSSIALKRRYVLDASSIEICNRALWGRNWALAESVSGILFGQDRHPWHGITLSSCHNLVLVAQHHNFWPWIAERPSQPTACCTYQTVHSPSPESQIADQHSNLERGPKSLDLYCQLHDHQSQRQYQRSR